LTVLEYLGEGLGKKKVDIDTSILVRGEFRKESQETGWILILEDWRALPQRHSLKRKQAELHL